MKTPRAVCVALVPSRLAAAGFCAASVATALLLMWLPVAQDLQAAGLGLVASAAAAILARMRRRHPRFVVELEVADDLRAAMVEASGRRLEGRVMAATYVGARFVSLVVRLDGARRSRAVSIVHDMLPREDFRQLRVMLRLARAPGR